MSKTLFQPSVRILFRHITTARSWPRAVYLWGLSI